MHMKYALLYAYVITSIYGKITLKPNNSYSSCFMFFFFLFFSFLFFFFLFFSFSFFLFFNTTPAFVLQLQVLRQMQTLKKWNRNHKDTLSADITAIPNHTNNKVLCMTLDWYDTQDALFWRHNSFGCHWNKWTQSNRDENIKQLTVLCFMVMR